MNEEYYKSALLTSKVSYFLTHEGVVFEWNKLTGSFKPTKKNVTELKLLFKKEG